EENRLHYHAQVHLSGTAQMTSRWHPPGNQCPLRIGHIACETQSTALILSTSDFGPRHGVLPQNLCKSEGITAYRNHSLLFRSGSQETMRHKQKNPARGGNRAGLSVRS